MIGQQAYSLPADFVLPKQVSVAGKSFDNADPSEVRLFEAGALSTSAAGLWWISEDGASLCLWQTPSEVQQVSLSYVYEPIALATDTDEPVSFPASFHPALLFYVKALYYGDVEDNPDLERSNRELYEAEVARLKSYRLKRKTGDGPYRIGLSGVTA